MEFQNEAMVAQRLVTAFAFAGTTSNWQSTWALGKSRPVGPGCTGRIPDLAAGDAGFYSAKNIAQAHQMGVKRVSVPSRSPKSAALKREQKKRWFKRGQKWRTGCEGRISVLKQRHGLGRCRYKGIGGMKRWTGLGVIADNLINMGRALDTQQQSAL